MILLGFWDCSSIWQTTQVMKDRNGPRALSRRDRVIDFFGILYCDESINHGLQWLASTAFANTSHGRLPALGDSRVQGRRRCRWDLEGDGEASLRDRLCQILRVVSPKYPSFSDSEWQNHRVSCWLWHSWTGDRTWKAKTSWDRASPMSSPWPLRARRTSARSSATRITSGFSLPSPPL